MRTKVLGPRRVRFSVLSVSYSVGPLRPVKFRGVFFVCYIQAIFKMIILLNHHLVDMAYDLTSMVAAPQTSSPRDT